ncbi:MAG: hypothetical protein H6834_02455 [Planctomycetes bacterium]|nr:hypothetical protein [Planctomycetota bacterium]
MMTHDSGRRPRPSVLAVTTLPAWVLAFGCCVSILPAQADKADKEAKYWNAWGLKEKDGRWLRQSDIDHMEKDEVQHSETGVWIPKADLEKAQSGQHLVSGQWVAADEAEKGHKSWATPWILFSDNIELHTIANLADAKNILNEAETNVAFSKNLLWDPTKPLPERVRVFAFMNQERYRDFGTDNDDSGFSTHGAFQCLTRDDKPVAVFYGAKDWGPYYLKHGVGLGVATQLLVPLGIPERHWILTGFGGYTSRWSNTDAASHFGKQYLAKGGVRSLKSFPKSFSINGEMSTADLDWTIYQAGILVAFLQKPNDVTQKAWDQVRDAIRERDKKTLKIYQNFEKKLLLQDKAIKAFLKEQVQ